METTTNQNPRGAAQEAIARIKSRRKSLGMSAEALAQTCTEQGYPLTRSTLANLETGRRDDIGLGELVAFAKALRTTVRELISEPQCEHCEGEPAAGFRCLHCGVAA